MLKHFLSYLSPAVICTKIKNEHCRLLIYYVVDLNPAFLLSFSAPQGVVRVHLVEARDLVAKDTYMMGMVKGKSDPYATLRVGNRQFKSKTVKENLYPTWNEVFEVE